MKKILSILLIVSLMCACTITAYADETTEPIETPPEATETSSEPSEPENEPAEPENTETPSGGDSEPSEPETESTEPEAAEPVEPETPTVNVSEESIKAIAEAVSDDVSFTITINGVTYNWVEMTGEPYESYAKNFLSAWETYPYKAISVNPSGGSSYAVFYSSAPPNLTLKNEQLYYTSPVEFTRIDMRYNEFKVERHSISTTTVAAFQNDTWSNFNIFDSDGNLVHASDVPLSFAVSFVTGFDDLTISDMTSNAFNAPTPSYDGYGFDGWYLDSEFTQPYTADYVFTGDTVLYAKWTPYVTVSFVTGFDDYVINPVEVLSGSSFKFSDFEYTDHEFVCAYTSPDFDVNSQFHSGDIITEDTVLYLKFEKINYTKVLLNLVDRMEGLVYVQMASIIMFIAMLIVMLFFNRRHGAS